ncbi:MAG: FxLYD domain-containing protein [Methanoculleus sp.]
MEKDSLPGRSLAILILLGCLLSAAVTAGCMGSSVELETPTTTPEAAISAYTTYVAAGPQPSFAVSATAPKKHMRTDGSCYWVASGTVTNTGDGPAKNVVIRFMLIDDESNMIRATETRFASWFAPDETKIFTIDPFPGDCDRQYHVAIDVMHDIS